MKRLILLFLTLVALAPAYLCAESKPKELRVAAVLGLTGPAAGHADGILKGIRLATEDLTARGWKIDLHVEDDQTDPAQTVAALQLLFAKKYSLFIGPTWSYQVSAARSLFTRDGVVTIVPGGSADVDGGAAPGIFNLCPSRLGMPAPIAAWLKRAGYQRPFVITPHGDWGELHRRVYLEAIEKAGLKAVGDETIDYGIQPAVLRSIVLKAKQKGSDIIFSTASSAEIAALIKARRDLQYPFAVFTSDVVREAVDGKLVSPDGETLKNVFVAGLGASGEFKERYRRIYKEGLKTYAERGYDALMILARASESTDGSPQAIRALLASSFDYTGVSGRVRFDASGDPKDGEYSIASARESL